MPENDDLETWYNPTESTVWLEVPDGSGGWKEVIVAAGRPIQMSARTREVNELKCAAGQSPFRNGLLERRVSADLAKLQPPLPPPPVVSEPEQKVETGTTTEAPTPSAQEKPVRIIESETERDDLAKTEAASADLTEADMRKLLAGPIRGIEADVEAISNPTTLRHLLKVGKDSNVNANKLAVVSARLAVVDPPRQAPLGTRPTT